MYTYAQERNRGNKRKKEQKQERGEEKTRGQELESGIVFTVNTQYLFYKIC